MNRQSIVLDTMAKILVIENEINNPYFNLNLGKNYFRDHLKSSFLCRGFMEALEGSEYQDIIRHITFGYTRSIENKNEQIDTFEHITKLSLQIGSCTHGKGSNGHALIVEKVKPKRGIWGEKEQGFILKSNIGNISFSYQNDLFIAHNFVDGFNNYRPARAIYDIEELHTLKMHGGLISNHESVVFKGINDSKALLFIEQFDAYKEIIEDFKSMFGDIAPFELLHNRIKSIFGAY